MANSPDSMKTVFSGAAMLMMGFVLGGMLTFATQIVIARLLNPDLFGVFSQAMGLLYMLVMVCMFGLNAGTSRFISYYADDREKAKSAVPQALKIALPLSVIVFGLVFLYSEQVASLLFNDPRTAEVLRVFSLAGPAMVLNSMIISGFRGFQSSKERVLLLDFVIPLLQIVGVVLLVTLGYGLFGATVGYASAFVLSSIAAVFWFFRDYGIEKREDVLEELVRFSWPIMISSVAVQVFLWSPPVVLGALAASSQVGLLNSALPLGAATKMFLSSFAFLLMPVASELVAKKDLSGLKQVYSDSTRWITYLSMPVLFFLAVFSRQVITFFFGPSYIEAGTVLLVMVAGYIVNMATGPVGDLLIAIGKTRSEMFANLFKLGVFGGLAAVLIPVYGAIGAAASFAAGMVVGNSLRLYFCWSHVGFFYTRDYLKPIAAATLGVLSGLVVPVSNIVLTGVVFATVYGVSMALMEPLTDSDIEVVEGFLQDFGIEENEPVRKILDFLN